VKRLAALVVLAVAAAVVIELVAGTPDAPEPEVESLGPLPRDATWVSPSGADRNPGTRKEPRRSLQAALNAMVPGDTLVLAPGSYAREGATIAVTRDGTADAPITIRGEPGAPRPRLLGAARIEASHVRLHHLLFDGPTGPVQERTTENPRGEQVQVVVGGDGGPFRDIEIADCEVRDSDWHAGIFVVHAEDVRILGNHIHHNGDPDDPVQANLSHGIYWDSGSGLVANNVVERNVARGIQLYPEPSGVVVTHNTIVANGRAGVQLGDRATGNVVVNNIVVFNGDRGIRSASLSGSGNRASTNLVWGNVGEVEELGTGLVLTETLTEPPLFADREYRLTRASPAVDRGIESGAVAFDRDGRKRPVGEGSDLGAYESW